MAKPRPKFCISEIVRLKLAGHDLYDHATAEITEMIYLVNQRIWVSLHQVVVYTGWAYKVHTSEGWVFEDQITKAQQPDTTSWLKAIMTGNSNENTDQHRKDG